MKTLLAISMLLSGCTSAADNPETDRSLGLDGETGLDETIGRGEPLAEVDVLVIGSGPAGLSAAWEARHAGASVVVLERASEVGGSGLYAGHFFAAGTSLQSAHSIDDSPEKALEEWPRFTHGGSADDPWVTRLAEESAETLEWIESFGTRFTNVVSDPEAGTVERIHTFDHGQGHPFVPIIEEMRDLVWLETQADALIREDGAVIGVELTELETGGQGWIRAEATVVATGGFARDLDRVREDRQELSGLPLVVEASLTSSSRGLDLLEAAGADIQNRGKHGVYLHSLSDPREGHTDEALWIPWLLQSIVVDSTGTRVANEHLARGLEFVELLFDAPGRELFVISSPSIAQGLLVPGYLWPDRHEEVVLSIEEGREIGAVTEASSPEELGGLLGIDGEGLKAALHRYEDLVRLGRDEDFGKDPRLLLGLGDGPLIGAPLVAGSAKSFVGARVDERTRVLDINGQVIPGLFAAGEASGFLGSEAVGKGFSGSVSACYLMGRIAGQESYP